MKRTVKLPKFKNEDEEREFWSKTDSIDVLDWSKAKLVTFPNLKPSLKTISIRLPLSMIDSLKVLANKQDVPYQSLMKTYLKTMIDREMKK